MQAVNDSQRTVAVILVAGRGMRLRPLTDSLPKCLVTVAGFPILHRQLEALQTCRVSEIFLVVGYCADAVRSYVRKFFPTLNINFVENPRFFNTNTLYSLALAADRVGEGRRVILLNGDVVFDHDILKSVLAVSEEKSVVALQMRPCGEEEIKVTLSANGSIAKLNKSISLSESIGEGVGINLFAPYFWGRLSHHLRQLQDRHPTQYFEYAIEKTIEDGEKIFPLDVKNSSIIEVDFPKDLEKAEKLFIRSSK